MGKSKGTIICCANHPHIDWDRNANGYDFPPITSPDGVTVQMTKHPDGTFEVLVFDTVGAKTTFRKPTPSATPKGIHVGVTWNQSVINLYLNGRPAGEQNAPPP